MTGRLLVLLLLSLVLLSGICSAQEPPTQKFEISENQLNELWTIAEQWEQLTKELLILTESSGMSSNELLMELINSRKVISAQQNSLNRSTKLNELTLKQLNVAQNSLDELNRSFKTYDQKVQSIIKIQDREIKSLKLQRLGLLALVGVGFLR